MAETSLDIVLPFVDSSDPAWQETFLAARHKRFITTKARDLFLRLFSNRYASYGMFRYWWRGYEKYGPPGKVHLLLQSESQVPSWLNVADPRIKIHYHADFMPPESLPSYNSSCIELCFLRRHLPDLSPFFLMMNDDFYFNAPCTIDDFVEDGHPLSWIIPRGSKFAPTCIFRSIVCNNFNLVSKTAGKPCPHYAHNHLAVCYDRDEIIKAMDLFWPDISRTLTRFRDGSNYNHWIFRYWQDFTGISRHSDKFPHHGYAEMPTCTRATIKDFADAKVVCFNDTNGKMSPIVEEYLATHFEGRSTFELG